MRIDIDFGRVAVIEILLPQECQEAYRRDVQRAMADAASGGGYILSSSNTVHPGVKPESFLAMIKAAQKHGQYA
jgi:uroporphyrinogen-III decarboxylase